MARRGGAANLRPRDSAACRRRAPARAARAHRRRRGVLAVELSVQSGDSQDRRGDRLRLHDRDQRPRRCAERGRRAGAPLPRRRFATGLPERRVGRSCRGVAISDQVADRAQNFVHRLRRGRQATGRSCRIADETLHDGAGRPCACHRVRRRRCRPRRRHACAVQVSQRGTSLHLADALLRAGASLRALRRAVPR